MSTKELTLTSKTLIPIGVVISIIGFIIAAMVFLGELTGELRSMSNEIRHHSESIEAVVLKLETINQHETRISGLEIHVDVLSETNTRQDSQILQLENRQRNISERIGVLENGGAN